MSLLCFPTDRAAYGRLAQLISKGQRRVEKGLAALWLDDVLEHVEGQILVVLPPPVPDSSFGTVLDTLSAAAPGRVYLAAQVLYRGDDRVRLERLAGLAERHRTPLVATGDVLYHSPERRPLQDVLSCIREKCTIDQAGLRLHANAERHLKPADEMARLFRHWPDAVARTNEIVRACRFSLDELRYDYPIDSPPDGLTEQAWLERLTWEGAAERYPEGVPDHVRELIGHEFKLIEELRYAPYFLTVYDIVRYARSRGILCQGRGSAANSAVCYCLGITAVDPSRFDLLFERFVSAERGEPPDIDVDFEHERREEVIQYIYEKYGREHAGIAATVIHYRTRSAIREVGKALGLSADVVGGLAGSVWGWSNEGVAARDLEERGMDPAEPRIALAVRLSRELIGFPRHLSQHVGGFVLTRSRLASVVPVLNGAMPERTFIEWDKDDLDALGILKIDVLGLGMLTCIRKAFELLGRHYGKKLDLATVPPEDPQVYEMLSRGDSLGVFQVESRAQMTMLPRLKPACFYDLIIEVAIVRPGPIQGDMVHPYLRRRAGLEPVVYPSGALKQVLEKTLGVPLFQEQAMKIAIIGAGFTAAEADRLRRAMATFKRVGTIDRLGARFIEGMVANGYDRAFAEKCFKQIEGFGTYGFPESHAASFALLVYVSSWIKRHYPEVFATALLNSQPMGFYAPAQIVRDARDHGVTVLPVEVNASDWDATLEVAAPQASDPTPPSAGASPAPSRGCIRSVASDASGSTSSIDSSAARSSPGSTRGCPGSSLLTAAALPGPGPGDPRNPRAAPDSAGRTDSHHSLRHPQNLTGGNEETVNAHTALRASCFSETAPRCAARTRPPEPDSPEDASAAAAGRDQTGPGATHGGPVNRSATSSNHPERGPCDPENPRAVCSPGARADSHHSLGHGWIMADEAEETVKRATPSPFGLPAPGPQGIHCVTPAVDRSAVSSIQASPVNASATSSSHPERGPCDPGNPRAVCSPCARADSHHGLGQSRNLPDKGQEAVDAQAAGDASRFEKAAGLSAARARPESWSSGDSSHSCAGSGHDRTDPGATPDSPVNHSLTSPGHPGHGPCDPGNPCAVCSPGGPEPGPCYPGNPRDSCSPGGRTDSHPSLRHDRNLADSGQETVNAQAVSSVFEGAPDSRLLDPAHPEPGPFSRIDPAPCERLVNPSVTSPGHPEPGPCDPGNPRAGIRGATGDQTAGHGVMRARPETHDLAAPIPGHVGPGHVGPGHAGTGADTTSESVSPDPLSSGHEACRSVDEGADLATSRTTHAARHRPADKPAARFALRLGFRQVKGLKEDEMRRLVRARGAGYADLADLRARARIGQGALDRLARADAFGSMALDRRGAIWTAIGLDRTGHELDPPPLFAWAERQIAGAEPPVELPAMTTGQHVAEDYRTLRLTLRAHPLALLRPRLAKQTIRAADLVAIENGRRVEAAGLVLVRQRPGTASGVIFVTLEDETGVINLVVWPKVFERFRRVVLGAQMMTVKGEVQKDGLVIHVIAGHLADRTDLLRDLSTAEIEAPVARADRFKRGAARRSSRRAASEENGFEAPLARADHAKSSGGPDSRDPLWRPRDIDHQRSHPHLFPAPLARADEVKRNTRNTQPSVDEQRRRHPPQATRLKGFKSRDFH